MSPQHAPASSTPDERTHSRHPAVPLRRPQPGPVPVVQAPGPGLLAPGAGIRTVGFGVRHPGIALQIGEVTHNATNISTNAARFSLNTGLPENDAHEGSHINAFRHTLWQATIASRFGTRIARQVGNAHEENPFAATGANRQQRFATLAQADETIDLLNNVIGRSIGEAHPHAPMQELALLALEHFRRAGLWTATPTHDRAGRPTGFTIAQTPLTARQYATARLAMQQSNNNGYLPAQQAARDAEIRADQRAAEEMQRRINRNPGFKL